MSPEYLAGFFDGEGCIDVQRMYPKEGQGRLYVRPRIRVAQTASCRVVLDELRNRFGGHLSARASRISTQRDSVSWEFLDRAGMEVMLEIMLPHLVIKREQARLTLWWLQNASGRHGANGRRPKLEEARRIFMEELKAMKLDPFRSSDAAIQVIKPLLD
jgi:hypothetical protein